jgi:prepilin-type N-terminal cleavage/methylation domain-containing protein
MTRDRRGFTMVELIVVTVLGSLVVLVALQVLITNRRAYTAQSATIAGQQTTRMAVDILFAELREVSPSGGDILAMYPDSITVRLMRKFSYVCATDFTVQPRLTVIMNVPRAGADTLRIMGGTNRFEVGDSVFVYADNNENIDTDDVWIPARVTAVNNVAVFCPQALLSPALDLTFNGQGALFAADSVGVGAPVRSYEEFTFGTTTMNGDVYLARRDTGDYVPMAGPLAPRDGLQFVYRDALGAVTATPTDVSQIEVTIRTGSEVLNSLGRLVQDSILVWIHTRN